MRERTPSAEDTPKRAPPAPPGEADVISGRALATGSFEAHRSSRLSAVIGSKMVASTHNLDDLGVTHPSNATEEIRQQQQQQHQQQQQFADKQVHAFKPPPPTAQDKRSRLSNVINNLRRKVPEPSRCESSTGRAPNSDERSSVECNLETLEKYVMTVLNGVIKEEEENGRRESEDRLIKESDEGAQEEAKNESQKSFEPSQPNESGMMEAAVPDGKGVEDTVIPDGQNSLNAGRAEGGSRESGGEERQEEVEEEDEEKEQQRQEEEKSEQVKEESIDAASAGKADKLAQNDEESLERKTLGTIIMDRLSDNHQEFSPQAESEKEEQTDLEVRAICTEILNDIIQLMDTEIILEQRKEPYTADEASSPASTTSLHCSLPLDKVASVLQACQESRTKGPTKPTSPTIRHLCLYCDRKFLSISLRQRHIERVHQSGGGRRSERNSRKPLQNCQYCSDKNIESLEALFQHMVGVHSDKYHGCLQCTTRYLTRDALLCHMSDTHSKAASEKPQEKLKERSSPCKDVVIQSSRDTTLEEESEPPKPVVKDCFSNVGSPEFDNSFYSSVSCNIRENLLHHLDGKLQAASPAVAENKPLTSVSEHSVGVNSGSNSSNGSSGNTGNQIQFSIDISLTAATPVYNKDYSSEEFDNSSEYAQKPGKGRTRPRRVSFEKYNFPRKYDGREQWTCSIKDLSKFDISTQLTLRKKQQMMDRVAVGNSQTTCESAQQTDLPRGENAEQVGEKEEGTEVEEGRCTIFSTEFGNFMKLRKWDESKGEAGKETPMVYAELTGEWSRPRVYICGACTARYVTLKEMEEHKASSHPNVWCSHFEFSGDQRELYKHLFLPGRSVPTAKARNATLPEKICTKCTKNCNTLAELHRHMLECGGDQAWLLGLFGNGKKKCKWRPFGSRSRRRRQRGMKRNIQNSQTPRVNVPKEKPPTGPRVRPSDRESIQKMLANLPPKRASRKVLQDSVARSQGRLRTVQTKTRPRIIPDNSSAKRMSRNKAVIRNKLLKNAKSFQRKRCRNDNLAAVIESVVNDYSSSEAGNDDETVDTLEEAEKGEGRKTREFAKNLDVSKSKSGFKSTAMSTTMTKDTRILGKRRNIKIKKSTIRLIEMSSKQQRVAALRSKEKLSARSNSTSTETISDITDEKKDSLSYSVSLRKKHFDGLTTIKARNQPRTHDGKFASLKKKEAAAAAAIAAAAAEAEFQSKHLQGVKTRAGNFQAQSNMIKKTVRKTKKDHLKTLPRRTLRLSNDADKISESEVQQKDPASDVEKTSADILLSPSPVMPAEQKCPRVSPRILKKTEQIGQETLNKDDLVDNLSKVTIDETQNKEKMKSDDVKKLRKREPELSPETSNSFGAKESSRTRNKKMLPKSTIATRRSLSAVEKETKDSEEKVEVPKKNIVTKNNGDTLSRNLKTRSNSRARLEQEAAESTENSDNITIEPKEDLLSNLGLKSRDKSIKRGISKQISKTKKVTCFDSKPVVNDSISMEREKRGVLRKSLRNLEKKTSSFYEQEEEEEEEVEEEETVESVCDDEKIQKAQPEISLREVKENEKESDQSFANELSENDSTKNTYFATEDKIPESEISGTVTRNRRRGRMKSKNVDKEVTSKAEDGELPSTIETAKDTNDEEKENFDEILEDLSGSQNESGEERKGEGIVLVNLNLEHLQQESCSSNVDSGKENSSDVPVSISKPKVVRPRKVRSQRRERASKRSLSNVIGILTEGVNIPVETQDSVVFTVQTSMDNMGSETVIQSNEQPLNVIQDVSNQEQNSSIIGSNNTVTNSSEDYENYKKNDNSPEMETGKADEEICDPSVITAGIAEPPATDIILDLSRRKTKGKGSFLEKIVSKIAKQKDVTLLDGETIICPSIHFKELSSNLDQNAECDNNVDLNTTETKIEESIHNSLQNNSNTTKKCKSNVISSEESIPKDHEESNNIIHDVESLKADLIKTSRRRSIKRPSDGESPKKNKKKLIEEEVPEESQEEIRLEDIMSFINQSYSTPRECFQNSEEKFKPGKRKTVDEEDEADDADIDNKMAENSKKRKSKMEVKKIKNDTLSIETEIEHDTAIKKTEENYLSIVEPVVNIKMNSLFDIKSLKKSEGNGTDIEKIPQTSEDLVEDKLKVPEAHEFEACVKKRKSSQKKENLKPYSVTEEMNCEMTSISKSEVQFSDINKTKKTLFDEHLDLSNPSVNPENTVVTIPKTMDTCLKEGNKRESKTENNDNERISFENPQVYQLTKKQSLLKEHLDLLNPTEVIDNLNVSKSQDDNKIIAETVSENDVEIPNNELLSLKFPETTENLHSTSKRSPKKKSLVPEHLVIEEYMSSKTLLVDPVQKSNEVFIEHSKPQVIENTTVSDANETDQSENALNEAKMPEKTPTKRALKERFSVSEGNDLSDNGTIADILLTKKRQPKKKLNTDKNLESSRESPTDEKIHADQRQTQEQKSKKHVSLLNEHLDLPDESWKNDEVIAENNEVSEKECEMLENESVAEGKMVAVREEKSENEDKMETAVKEKTMDDSAVASELENNTTEDFQTPNKRPKGNFAVVHTKSGEILIVEKKKKFTKEAAKFFCNVCTTSFTRKSSLKKHNQSQSHHIQLSKSGQDQEKKTEQNEEVKKENFQESSDNNDQTAKITENEEKPSDRLSSPLTESDDNSPGIADENMENSSLPIEAKDSILDQTTEEALEDELLDEEICKITENMTHDEYVLTDHVSPTLPEASSTPSIKGTKKLRKKNTKEKEKEEKRKKEKKRNLAEEHLDLNTPDLIDDLDRSISNIASDDFPNYCASVDDLESVNSLSLNFPTHGTSCQDSEKKMCDEEVTIKTQKFLKVDNAENLQSTKSGKRPGRKSKASKKLELSDFINVHTTENSRPKRKQYRQSYKELEQEFDDFFFDERPSKRELSRSRHNNSLNVVNDKQDSVEVITNSNEQNYSTLPLTPKAKKSVEKLSKKKQNEDEHSESKIEGIDAVLDVKATSETSKFDAFEDIRTLDCDEPLNDNTENMTKETLEDIKFLNSEKQDVTEPGAFHMFEKFNQYDLDDRSKVSTIESKSQDNLMNDSATTEFESNENSLNTNMSMDIQKIIDDPELSTDNANKKCNKSSHNEVGILHSTESRKVRKAERNAEEKMPNDLKKTPRSGKISKTLKTKGRKSKVACDEPSNSEYSDSEDRLESQTKGKIVKSVFGRVFCGEKVDKAKEVMEDWDCKSIEKDVDQNSSIAENLESPKKKRMKEKKEDTEKYGRSRNREGKRSQNSETGTLSSNEPELFVEHSRCRQSKKRAEERISRAFEDDSPVPYDDQSSSLKVQKSKDTAYELRNQSKPDIPTTTTNSMECNDEDSEGKNEEVKKKGKRKCKEDIPKEQEQIVSYSTELDEPPPKSSMNVEEFTIDSLLSVNPKHSNLENDDDDDDDEDENMSCRRMSPIFAYNTLDSSLGESSESGNEAKNNVVNNEEDEDDEEEEEEEEEEVEKNGETRRKSSFISEFSGDKVVIRSPPSSFEARPDVVIIAPTDAIEDNALDVPQEIEIMNNPKQNSRQGKVLNFDEELFVECCSRLKATSEKELRGAKKIKLDHSDGYHRKDEQSQIFRSTKDRWRDIESQNSLGSLLESVNQLLGEEMYSTREKVYEKRDQTVNSERSSRSASPNVSQMDNLGYEDSLDVAFEHNNKLRDKIQQRMRESENLLANTFGQKSLDMEHHRIDRKGDDYEENGQPEYMHQEMNGIYNDRNDRKESLDSSGYKNKISSTLGGILDKALSNLLHSNNKHDHNGSTPMKVLAELACARAPTSMPVEIKAIPEKPAKTMSIVHESVFSSELSNNGKNLVYKKVRNPIKELFERKKEINDRKQIEKSKVPDTDEILKTIQMEKAKKSKRPKKRHDFPLIRNSLRGGLPERKKRRDNSFDKRDSFISDKIKDVYDFDEDESQPDGSFSSGLSYRNKAEVTSTKNATEFKVDELPSLDTHAEKFAPKTKGALKCFQAEEKTERNGPMDNYVERKPRHKRLSEHQNKHLKSKKKTRNLKKKQRHAWYENDSSDEFVTAVKTEDVGVGISKSQRTCSKGKQNLFAELSTSSESDFEENEDKEKRRKNIKNCIENNREFAKKISTDCNQVENNEKEEYKEEEEKEQENQKESFENDWSEITKEVDIKKSESEMSDHPLVIDEKKDGDESRNSDDDCDTPYDRCYDMDDLYREDSSVSELDYEDDNEIMKQQDNFNNGKKQFSDISNDEKNVPFIGKISNSLNQFEDLNDTLKISEKTSNKEQPSDMLIAEKSETLLNQQRIANAEDDDDDEYDNDDNTEQLPEKLSGNEKPDNKSDNLPLHVFLSRKVQESKKRKQQQQELKKLQEEQERILANIQSNRRQRKCAIGKQGLLAEFSSSDEDFSDDVGHRDKKPEERQPRKQKRESKETRKERYLEKQREKRFANEQKAIEEMILRDVKKKKEQTIEKEKEKVDENIQDESKKQHIHEEPKKQQVHEEPKKQNIHEEPKKRSKSCQRPVKTENKVIDRKRKSTGNIEWSKGRSTNKDKERRHSTGKRDANGDDDDEELRTTKSWNKVEEGVGVAIGRRKRAAVNQLYYWSSSSDEEETPEMTSVVEEEEEEEDDRQEQHGWIVGDSHKKMITMLAMEKQLKEKRRRNEEEVELGKGKGKKHKSIAS